MTSTSIERQELNTHSISRLAVVAAAALLLAGCAAPAPQAQVAVESDSVSIADAWVKSADEGMSAAFGVLSNDGDADVTDVEGVAVPVCPACGGMLRPNVVYFGEHVPYEVFTHAEEILDGASALLVAGTSLAVNTGVRLVNRAERRDMPIAVINKGPTAIDMRPSVELRIEGGTSQWLAALATRLGA